MRRNKYERDDRNHDGERGYVDCRRYMSPDGHVTIASLRNGLRARKKERLRHSAEAVISNEPMQLFQSGLHGRERRIELRAEPLNNGDDCDRDTSDDEAVFDGGRARLVLQELHNKCHHRLLLL
jgi:hypothetical protein